MVQTTTKFHVEVMLKNFADYVNPDSHHDPWFTLPEINQQFAWEDLSDEVLTEWLNEMIEAGDVESMTDRGGTLKYRWLS